MFTFDEFMKEMAVMIEKGRGGNTDILISYDSAPGIYNAINDLQVGLRVEKQRAERCRLMLFEYAARNLLRYPDFTEPLDIMRDLLE